MFAIVTVGLAGVLVWDRRKQSQARRDRELMRRFHRYMAMVSYQRRPW
jgi:hypothetical protein